MEHGVEQVFTWVIFAAAVAVFYGQFMGEKHGEHIQATAIIFLIALVFWPVILIWIVASLVWKAINK